MATDAPKPTPPKRKSPQKPAYAPRPLYQRLGDSPELKRLRKGLDK